jgi:flagellar biosynthesis/type III secretory pathway protein FliH
MRDQHPYSQDSLYPKDNIGGRQQPRPDVIKSGAASLHPQAPNEGPPPRHTSLDGKFFESFAQLPIQRGQGTVVRSAEIHEFFDAQQTLHSLRQQIDDLQGQVDQATADGHETGLSEGRSEAAREFAGHLTRIEQEVSAFFNNAETTIADLAVRVAETIIGEVGGPNADYLAISKALSANIDREAFIVHASADSVQVVRRALADLKTRLPQARLPVAKLDNRLPPGRAVLVTRFGSVDLDVHSQLKAIRENLANADRDLDPHHEPDLSGDDQSGPNQRGNGG